METPTTPQAALIDQLGTTAVDSKKYQMVSRAMLIVGVVFSVAMIAIVFKGSIAKDIIKLATLAIGSTTALVGIYTGVQGATDWKNMAALSSGSGN